MDLIRRDFLKFCVGSAAALGLELSPLGTLDDALAAGLGPRVPSYPIAENVYTTLERTVSVIPPPSPPYPAPPNPGTILLPSQVSAYASSGYGDYIKDSDGYPDGPQFPYLSPPMEPVDGNAPTVPQESVPDPDATPLLSFFTISDIHIADKESPAQCNYFGYNYPEPTTPPPNPLPLGNSSAYSAVILYTTQVLDAAVQTINAVHKKMPFDFGMGLGDAANNTQYNELRWYLDVLDGKMITPSSGIHKGAKSIDYQKPYQAAGLDKSIRWYQTIGNHDQFWMGSAKVNNYLRKTYTGPNVLNVGQITTVPPTPAEWDKVFSTRGFYMGVVDGTKPYGDIIYSGPTDGYHPPPKIAADLKRRSLLVSDWMSEFFNTTTKPVGHGFTPQNVNQGFACYSFVPKANIPIKVIVLDDTDKVNSGAAGSLDEKRFAWLVNELDAGETAGQLMIICAHIPIRPYAQKPTTTGGQDFPPWSLWAPNSEISEDTLFTTLHNYKNLILWCSGHVHRNCITPQQAPGNDPEYDFWEVETPSLRDFPRQFRRFEIVYNTDKTISIFALDVDVAANPEPLGNGAASPPLTSLSYAVATQEIFQNPIPQGPNIDASSGVYNAELIKQISTEMQEKLSNLSPVVGYFKINDDDVSTSSRTVTLNNNVLGSTPTQYMASEFPNFKDAVWQTYSKTPSFTLSRPSGAGGKTVYFKVKDAAGRISAVVNDSIRESNRVF